MVFEDQTGVHLGAGPYILIYNCVASPPDEEVDVVMDMAPVPAAAEISTVEVEMQAPASIT